jgi:acetyltransferase-like isoleucine patch superfamily enzyme
MVKNKIRIGYDCIIAWNVFITDCDWHSIEKKSFQKDVFIGDHVWIAANSSILKGSVIGEGSIIAAHSVVRGEDIPERSVAGGNPIRVIETDVLWHRDIED